MNPFVFFTHTCTHTVWSFTADASKPVITVSEHMSGAVKMLSGRLVFPSVPPQDSLSSHFSTAVTPLFMRPDSLGEQKHSNMAFPSLAERLMMNDCVAVSCTQLDLF